MISKDDLLELGFQEIPHFTVMGSVVYELGRNRLLTVGCAGTPNETMFIVEKSKVGDHYTDLVCMHNHDYDGYLSKESVAALIEWFKNKKKVK